MKTLDQALSARELAVLYQVLGHTEEVSPYGFGDLFWVTGPSLDELAIELTSEPHRFIEDVNALEAKGLVTFEEKEDGGSNFVCPTADGWRLHPRFGAMVPWIASGEGFQDWESQPEFEGLSSDEIEALARAASVIPSGDRTGVAKAYRIRKHAVNKRIRKGYVVWPTAPQLEKMLRKLKPDAHIHIVVPSSGLHSCFSAIVFLGELADLRDDRISVVLDIESLNIRDVEAAYLSDGDLYLITTHR